MLKLKEKYTDGSALAYYLSGLEYQIMHKETRKLLEELLYMLAEKGEKATFLYIKNNVLKTKNY